MFSTYLLVFWFSSGFTLASFLPEKLGSDQTCIASAQEYMENLDDILNRGDTAQSLCEGVQLMSRIQSLNVGQEVPNSLSKYGVYWAFASGPQVLNTYLQMAEDHQDDNDNRVGLLKDMLFYAGFSYEMIAYEKVYSLVVFDKLKMDTAWQSGPFPNIYGPFQPTWLNLATYFNHDFQVCSSASLSDCVETQAPISDEAITQFLSVPYTNLTGCKEGFPQLTERSVAECMTDCPETYCLMIDSFKDTYSGGSPACVARYNDPPEQFLGSSTLWARAFLEACISCSKWFTGEGIGYDPDEAARSGVEWLVRGDINVGIDTLDSARYTVYQPSQKL